MKCKICLNESAHYAQARILNRYEIDYFQCPICSFVQTEEPYWLEEAYSDAIAKSDIGILARNIHLSNKISAILKICFKTKFKFLDYGAGYGIFVRLMRDRGFDFYWDDKYCKNLFSSNFTAQNESQYDVLTAFELFEHFDAPIPEIEHMFSIAPNIIFSTNLLPDAMPKPNQWWYFSLSSGQHIAFYTKKSLEIIAEKYRKHYIATNGIHILSKEKIPAYKFFFAVRFASLVNKLIKRDSLLPNDYNNITGIEIK